MLWFCCSSALYLGQVDVIFTCTFIFLFVQHLFFVFDVNFGLNATRICRNSNLQSCIHICWLSRISWIPLIEARMSEIWSKFHSLTSLSKIHFLPVFTPMCSEVIKYKNTSTLFRFNILLHQRRMLDKACRRLMIKRSLSTSSIYKAYSLNKPCPHLLQDNFCLTHLQFSTSYNIWWTSNLDDQKQKIAHLFICKTQPTTPFDYCSLCTITWDQAAIVHSNQLHHLTMIAYVTLPRIKSS